ncbi:MAG: hypothetical protein A2498_05955 [Lentisphaerae bacterium RIFOXYC12_FULL_60_16]|nr:MAG: hypothetical protein A2498_05955 [Lentisphaerae bacterium RIFOXYC12_FULL_60_16]
MSKHDGSRIGQRVCLGLDVGGTFTDAVLFDGVAGRVICKAKAPTTPWDVSLGVGHALGKLDAACFAAIERVSISTTLATNAIVEGKGQPVGLLIMPPYGRLDPDNFNHTPREVIDGQMDIDGTELVPVNPAQVMAVVRRMMAQQQVTAFAVAGYAGHVNPAHELAVKDLVQAQTGLTVTCGYEITEGMNYRVRAETAALNARIIPYLSLLIHRVRGVLEEHAIRAPVMVVRSDGTLASLQAALERPILTILSGPAASMAGARYLSNCPDAVVVDIGGTTTDMALLKGRDVPLCRDGARVGPWQTHVPALDMRTVGLGGDSRIVLRHGVLSVGPRRVAPVGWLAQAAPDIDRAIEWLEREAEGLTANSEAAEFLIRRGTEIPDGLTESDHAILTLLTERPMSLHELGVRLNAGAWEFVTTENLENRCLVQRCGLTPTDVLQAEGRLSLYGVETSKRLLGLYAGMAGVDRDRFAGQVLTRVVNTLACDVVQTILDRQGLGVLAESPQAQCLMDNALSGGNADLAVQIKVRHPVIGVGAPAAMFVPEAALRLGATAVIPEHADVANAVGAAISSIQIIRRVAIGVDETGCYRVEGMPDTPRFSKLEAAEDCAESFLRSAVMAQAAENGLPSVRIVVERRDQIARTRSAVEVFLQRVIEVRMEGGTGQES